MTKTFKKFDVFSFGFDYLNIDGFVDISIY